VRKQYHFRPGPAGVLAWDVDRLIELSKRFACFDVSLSAIRELDEPFWFAGGSEAATPRAILEHVRLINGADLTFPIILSADGRVMDGMHRVARAALLGHATVRAVQFPITPEPDFVGVGPDDLPDGEPEGPKRGSPP
jgi:hypothetical protein